MGSPVTSDSFQPVTTASNLCEGFKLLLRIPGLLKTFFTWFLDDAGNISVAAADGIAEYFTPVGVIVMWGGASIPSNRWLVCNGQAVNRTTYARLFQRYGTTWGAGDGSTTFNLPNMQDRFPRGSGASNAIGTNGGADTKTLTAPNVPTAFLNHFHGTGRRSSGLPIDSFNNDFDFIMRQWDKPGTYRYNTCQGEGALWGYGDFNDTGTAATTNAIMDVTTPPQTPDAFDVKPAFVSVYFIIKVL